MSLVRLFIFAIDAHRCDCPSKNAHTMHYPIQQRGVAPDWQSAVHLYKPQGKHLSSVCRPDFLRLADEMMLLISVDIPHFPSAV